MISVGYWTNGRNVPWANREELVSGVSLSGSAYAVLVVLPAERQQRELHSAFRHRDAQPAPRRGDQRLLHLMELCEIVDDQLTQGSRRDFGSGIARQEEAAAGGLMLRALVQCAE